MELGKDIIMLGHASFLLRHEGKNIYIDPYNVAPTSTKADLIIITHAHPDHYDQKSIDNIITAGTPIIASRLCEGIEKYQNVTIMEPGQSASRLDISIESVPAYNTNPEKLKWHPKENRWMGYIIEADGRRIYHAGDTDFVPEMKSIDNLYAALLPMGGTYTMGVGEMIEAAKALGAENTVPIHYRRLLGDKAKAAEEKLAKEVDNVVILQDSMP